MAIAIVVTVTIAVKTGERYQYYNDINLSDPNNFEVLDEPVY